jgi:beta-fructofuranosidase
MFVHPGNHIGDAWYFVNDDEVHMFYLTDPTAGGSSSVGHAVSNDLMHWRILPIALEAGPEGAWDDLRICTGSTIRRDGRYWMAYSGTSTVDSSWEEKWRVQRMGMAVSDDLIEWEKSAKNPVLEADGPQYERMGSGQRQMVHFRDPYLFDDGNAVVQFTCARRADGDIGSRGAVALARSTDFRSWELLPPLEHDRVSDEMEVPQVYEIGGRWYLVFVTLGRFLTPEIADRFGDRLPERSNFSMVGDSPFGPFRMHGTGQIIAHPPEDYFYAAQLVPLGDQWFLLATIHDEAVDRVCDPIPVTADETGVHAEWTPQANRVP